jgi:nucleoside-diphosphate-sugar epimerase
MTANLLEQAGGDQPCRFIFASSNHAMGGYKDAPLPADGKLRMSTPQMSGTRYWDGEMYRWGSAYGATKALGERAAAARAAATRGRITAVSTRIGWCQGGANLATTLMRSGGGDKNEPNPEVVARNMKWYRDMWLSNGDHARLMAAALTADASNWPAPAIVVSGMSNNAGMPWDLEEAKEWIGYVPEDDVWADLKAAGLL